MFDKNKYLNDLTYGTRSTDIYFNNNTTPPSDIEGFYKQGNRGINLTTQKHCLYPIDILKYSKPNENGDPDKQKDWLYYPIVPNKYNAFTFAYNNYLEMLNKEGYESQKLDNMRSNLNEKMKRYGTDVFNDFTHQYHYDLNNFEKDEAFKDLSNKNQYIHNHNIREVHTNYIIKYVKISIYLLIIASIGYYFYNNATGL
jgi:hypothetical protein